MGLIATARGEMQRFINDEGEQVTFTTPGNSITKTIKGFPIKHSLGINDYGQPVQSKTARVTISEEVLEAAGYPVRANDNSIDLKDHKVSWVDSSGFTYTYVINKIFPSRTVGTIVCELSDYTTGTEPKKIIGWADCTIYVNIVTVPDPEITQTLDNGDVIPLEYALNVDGTFTVPYLQTIPGMNVLIPFMLNNNPYQQKFDDNGVFTFTFGALSIGDEIAINAALPVYLP